MVNPYGSFTLVGNTVHDRRPVRGWALLSCLLFLVAALVSIPALFILNQERGIYPLTVGLFDIESDGESISLHAVMICLFWICLAILSCSVACGVIAWCNTRLTGRLPR